MDKNNALKIVNPLLAILMVNQPLSAFLSVVTGWDFLEGLHVGGGVLLVAASAAHLLLNWRWVTTNFFRAGKKQSA